MPEITEAKRLIAASSPEGMRILGMGVSRPCFAGRYNAAARAALEDPAANLSSDERRLIASFIEEEASEDETRERLLQVRLTASERAELQDLASEAGVSVSELVRRRALGRDG